MVSSGFAVALLELTGDKQLGRKLAKVSREVQTKVCRPAVHAMLKTIERAAKAGCPRREIKRTIRSRFKKPRRAGDVDAKVGAGVGGGKKKKDRGREKGHGVGISARNVHWEILGTKQRFTGTSTRVSGHRGERVKTKGAVQNRGRMPRMWSLKEAAEGAWPAALGAARVEALERLSEISAG